MDTEPLDLRHARKQQATRFSFVFQSRGSSASPKPRKLVAFAGFQAKRVNLAGRFPYCQGLQAGSTLLSVLELISRQPP